MEHVFVYLMPVEVRAIAAFLGLTRKQLLDRFCSQEQGEVSLRTDAPACPFLGPDRRCGIYPVRPRQCASWPFWQENLDPQVWESEVRALCPGIGQGELHPAEEVERIAREDARFYGLG